MKNIGEVNKFFFERRKKGKGSQEQRKKDTIESGGRATIAKQRRTSEFLENKKVQV